MTVMTDDTVISLLSLWENDGDSVRFLFFDAIRMVNIDNIRQFLTVKHCTFADGIVIVVVLLRRNRPIGFQLMLLVVSK